MKISYKLDEKELELIEKAEKITCYDYHRKDDLIPADEFISIIEDLLIEIEHIQEEFEDYKKRETNDYDPEIEIPKIHGKNISY